MGNTKEFKILSIDGGGIRGIIPAKVLCDLEEEILKKDGPNARLCDYFDLVCGTSTGAIIAIGIALGMTAKEILSIYQENAETIFPKHTRFHALISLIKNKPLYDRENLKKLLENYYGKCTRTKDTRIKDCKTRLCVPVYDLDKGTVHVFKTDHCAQFTRDCHIPVVDVALSTAAAPVYFSPHTFHYQDIGTTNTNHFYNNIDGGVLANNPALIGLTEAMYCLNIPMENINLLSIGTGTMNLKDSTDNEKIGVGYWINPRSSSGLRIYELMSSAQSIYIDGTINMMCKGAGCSTKRNFNYVRVQKLLDYNIALNATDKKTLERLENFGQELYKEKSELMRTFIENKITPYEHQK